MNILIKIFILVLIICSYPAYGSWREEKEGLEKVIIVDEFRIFYSDKGKHKLPDKHKIDINKNGIPDYVDDIIIQLTTASRIFEKLGFTHPLNNNRYKSQKVKVIDVHILNSKTGGGAGDAIIQFDYKSLYGDKPIKALAINLSNNLKYHSLTPMHEFFHLIQNGYTMFKNSWYEEGLAKWSEWVFRYGSPKGVSLPKTNSQLESIFNKKYATYSFWARIAKFCDNHSSIFNDNYNIVNYRYVDGTSVIQDNILDGTNVIISLLANMQNKDRKTSYINGYDIYAWEEKQQRDESNIPFILCSIKESILSQCNILNKETETFIHLIDDYTKQGCLY